MVSRVASALLTGTIAAGCYLSHELDERIRETTQYAQVVAGADHTCALTTGGRVLCWGLGQHGEIGDGGGDPARCDVAITEGPFVDRPRRVDLGGASGASSIAAGRDHSCASDGVGRMSCWGGNCLGQLGIGTTRGELSPVAVEGEWDRVWGGARHSCARSADGGFHCWGANSFGQLGLGTMSPLSEPGATTPQIVAGIDGVVEATLGTGHTCAIDGAAGMLCWGANGAGQLGDGTFDVRSRPAGVVGIEGAPRAISAGDRHTCAIIAAGDAEDAWCWGLNDRGQCAVACAEGDVECVERPIPRRVALPGSADAIASGSLFSCAIVSGAVWCWGANDVGQLGDGSTSSSAAPRRVDGIDDAIAITAGANHACAIRADRTLWCWGRNAQGQVGDGTLVDRRAPVPVGAVSESE